MEEEIIIAEPFTVNVPATSYVGDKKEVRNSIKEHQRAIDEYKGNIEVRKAEIAKLKALINEI
jgi:peptidoglycan hydrolase CwlO-like protein